VQHSAVNGVRGADLDDHEIVPLHRKAVVRHRHRSHRRRDQPWVDLVPEQRAHRDVAAHLGDRPGACDDARPEPFGQYPGGEPVVAVTVGDEDVGQVLALLSDPVPERPRLVERHPRVGEHRLLTPIDQRAGHGRKHPRLTVGSTPSCGGGSLTNTS
jgi:hypothetical protein